MGKGGVIRQPAFGAGVVQRLRARSGAVRASVTVQDKYASGSGMALGRLWSRDLERPFGRRAAQAIGSRSEADIAGGQTAWDLDPNL